MGEVAISFTDMDIEEAINDFSSSSMKFYYWKL